MLRIPISISRKSRIQYLLSIAVLTAMLGTLYAPATGMAENGTDPIIRLSSEGAPACNSGKESCINASFKADLKQTASYVFDCRGDSIDLPLLEWFLELLGVPLSLFEKLLIPGVPTPLCTLFAQGSTFKITEIPPIGTHTTLVEKTYVGGKHDGTFAVKANHTYEISLNTHGRDFREALKSNNLNLTFDSFAEVTYREIDPNDDICKNAIPFDLPYSGNLEFSGDHDWQRIKSPVKGTMVLNLNVPTDKDYQLEVRNDACSAVWVLSQNGMGVDEQFVMPVDPVYYRVHVYGKTPDDFGAWYSVSALWDLDDNQWENAAYFNMPFEGNLEFSGDHDWQQINAPAGKTSLVLDVPEGKNYDLELWQDDAKIQLAASTNGAGVDETLPLTQPGLYRIHIYGVRASDFNAPYHVFLEGTGPVTLVRDLAEGSPSSSLSELTSVNGTLYFVADNVLWKSDGTEDGTVKVVASGGSFSHPHGLTDINGKLYFAASPGEDIWVSDGTRDGTMRLGLTTGYTGNISELTNVNGDLYFVAFDCGSGFPCNILMNQNGEVFKEFDNPGHFPLFTNLTNVDGTLYFVFSDYRGIPTNPPTPPKLFWQLMKVTGSDEDPVVVGDIPGDESNPPGNFHAAGGSLYFVANDGIHGTKLWRSDGATIEMVPAVPGTIPQIGGAFGAPQEIINIGEDVFFTDGRALWIIVDTGNAEGIFCYSLTTSCVGRLGQLTNVDGTLYFVHSWENGTTLLRHDSNGTSGVKVFPVRTPPPPPPFVPILSHLTNVNGTLFFSADDGINGAELWKSDGTEESTTMVADIAPGSASSDPSELTNVNGTLFFAANDGVHGNELWRTVDSTPPPSHLTVTSNADSGPGSLRWAIASLASGGTIDFAFTQPTTIALISGELVIDKAMTINGPGAEILTIRTTATGQSGNYSRVFNISGNEVHLNGLTIRDGKQPAGGAGILNSGSLMLTQCELINNFATGATGPGGHGGAILNTENGTLSVVNCIITGSRAASGAGIYNSGSLRIQKGFDGNVISGHSEVTNNGAAISGGGIFNQGNADIYYTTLSNNGGSQAGGGIRNSGTLAMVSSELIDNDAFNGGGISNSSSMTLRGVVFTRNHAAYGGGIDNYGYADVYSVFTENDADSRGGAIRNDEQGTMSIVASIYDNKAEKGGAIYNQGALTAITTGLGRNEADQGGGFYNEGQMDIGWQCTLHSNSSRVGGAIYNKGTLTIDTSSVVDNSATQDGGGIYNDGTLKISGWVWHDTVGGKKISASVSYNTAGGSGGGIVNSKNGTVEIKTGLISDNSATENGGGIYNLGGTVTINDSTLSLNTADAGGGVYNENGTVVLSKATVSSNTAQVVGGILQESGELILNNSSVNGNVATKLSVTGGGGIRNGPNSILTITNSTISNNTTNNLGGSGIENFGTLTLTNATITGNSGSPDSPGFRNLGTASLRNSLIAGNVGPSVIGQDCDGTLNSQGYNLIQDTTRCIIIGDTTGNLLGVDPLLGSLQDNGGPTFTHALLPGSPAINAIDQGVCPPPDTDQRGVSRPQGQNCDIGAYEALNNPPTASANGPYTVDEGSIVTLDASSSTDPDGDLITYKWDLDNDGEFDDAAGVTATTIFPDDGRFPVAVRVTDPAGAQSTDSAIVNVLNVAPTILAPINIASGAIRAGTSIGAIATFTDPGTLDTHTALWDWGDGTSSDGLVQNKTVTGSHAYTKPGLYTVTLTVSDDDGGSDNLIHRYVAVYDPKAGFVTGGGWFKDSRKFAQFGFVAYYPPNGGSFPKGSVVFQLPSGRMNFHSTRFDWLIINGSKIQIQGTGTINRSGNYAFLLTASDGKPDKFRIKIWDKATGEVIYDNQPGTSDTADPTTAIQGGSIVIHKPN